MSTVRVEHGERSRLDQLTSHQGGFMAREKVSDTVLTDLENARRFADEHRGDIRHVVKSHRWLVWDGTRWRPDDTAQIQRLAKETVQRLLTSARAVKD